MKIIIPMAGRGRRFDQYLIPKPLIEIDGKPMIEHVVSMFPRDSEFVFICHESHLATTPLFKVLSRAALNGRIVSVGDDMLGGPAVTCRAAFDVVADDEEVIVNYCDFVQVWEFGSFMEALRDSHPDGAVVSFRGFHPSSMGTTYYAYLKVDNGGMITDVREKRSFAEDRTLDYASTGTYYFRSGRVFKDYVARLVERPDCAVNGEYYMSLPYNLMIADGLRILNYEVAQFITFGTPRDYELYKFWSEFFLRYSPGVISFDNVNLNATNIFPLAGGDRDFAAIGYDGPNFVLPIMNKSLAYYSLKTTPKGVRNIFICLRRESEHMERLDILEAAGAEVLWLDSVRNGNAATIYEARGLVDPALPVCVSGATYLLDYDERRLSHLMEEPDVDVILFAFSHHECVLRNPSMFAYAHVHNHIEVDAIIEKRAISSNPYRDYALTGTAIFRRAEDLFTGVAREMGRQNSDRVYFLSSVNHLLGIRKVVIFEVDKFVPVRSAADYQEFVYWQDYFDSCGHHPYSKTRQ